MKDCLLSPLNLLSSTFSFPSKFSLTVNLVNNDNERSMITKSNFRSIYTHYMQRSTNLDRTSKSVDFSLYLQDSNQQYETREIN